MFLSSKPRMLLAVLLASLAVSSCLATPTGHAAGGHAAGGPANVTPPNRVLTITPPAPNKNKAQKAPREITNHVLEWMKSKEVMFRGMPFTTGGTEIWCHYDFEIETKIHYKIDIETKVEVREQRVYKELRNAADWTFKEGNQHKGLILELKIESSSVIGQSFIRKVWKDQAKILSEFKEEYKNYDKAVLAIAWNKETHDRMAQNHMEKVGTPIFMHTHPDQFIQLYEWDGELGDAPPEDPNPLAADAPLANPGQQSLPLHPPSGGQTPSDHTSSGSQPSDKTPSKKTGKGGMMGKAKDVVKDMGNKLRPSNKNKKGPGGGAGGSTSAV